MTNYNYNHRHSKHENGWPAVDTNDPWHYSFEGDTVSNLRSLRKRQREVIVAIAALVLWFVMWGALGYFFGIRGVGFGWPAFWGVGGISLLIPGGVAIILAFGWLAARWIKLGD